MYKQKLLLVFFIIASLNSYAQDQGEWTFQQCVEYAIENNLYVKLQNYDVDERTEEFRQARAQRYPNLNGFYSHSFNRGLNPDPITNQNNIQNVNTGNIGAQIGVPIFNGFRINNSIKQSKANIESAELGKEKIENEIIIQVTENYLDVIYKYENIEISKKRVTTLQEQVDRTKRLVEAGSAPLSELLDLMSQFADTERQLTEAENAHSIAMLTLKQSMQLDFSTAFSIQIPQFQDPDTTIQFSTSSDAVFEESKMIMPEIKQAEVNISSAEYQEKIAKGAYYPTVNFNGNLNTRYASNYVNPIDPQDNSIGTQFENFFSQAATVQLNIPLYNRRDNKTQVNKAKIAIKKNEVQLQQELNDLRKKIEQAYINALSAQKTYISSKKSVESLEEQFRSVNKRFVSGAASTTDYVVAENNLNIAKAELNRAKYQFIFSRKILDFYEGKEIVLE